MQRFFALKAKEQFEADLEFLESALPSSFANDDNDLLLTRCLNYCFDREDRLLLLRLFFTLFKDMGRVHCRPELVYCIYLLQDKTSDWVMLAQFFSPLTIKHLMRLLVKHDMQTLIEAELSGELNKNMSLSANSALRAILSVNLKADSSFYSLLDTFFSAKGGERSIIKKKLLTIFNREAKTLHSSNAAEKLIAGEEEYLYMGGYFYLQNFMQGKTTGYLIENGYGFVLRKNTPEAREAIDPDSWGTVFNKCDIPCVVVINVAGAVLEKLQDSILILRQSQHHFLKIKGELNFPKVSLFESLYFTTHIFDEFLPAATHQRMRSAICKSVLKTSQPAEDYMAWKKIKPFLQAEVDISRPSVKL